MADDKSTQETSSLTQKEKTSIETAFHNGLRVLLSAYLLARLLFALSLQIVNDSTNDDGTFDIENAKEALRKVKEGCNKQVPKKKPEPQAQNTKPNDFIGSKNGSKPAIDDKSKKKTKPQAQCTKPDEFIEETVELLRQIGTLSQTWLEKPEDIDEGIWQQLNIYKAARGPEDNDSFLTLQKRMRVDAVHKVCHHFKAGLGLFKGDKVVVFWKDLQVVDEGTKLKAGDMTISTPSELIQDINDARNDAAHPDVTKGNTGGVGTFIEKLDKVDRSLKPYFQDPEMSDVDKKKNLKLLFAGDADILAIDKTYVELRKSYDDFEEKVMEKLFSLVPENDKLKAGKREMDEKIWSMVKKYYAKFGRLSLYEEDSYYRELLEMVRNPRDIISNHPEDGQPLQDLKALHELGLTTPEQADASAPDVEEEDDFWIPTRIYGSPARPALRKGNTYLPCPPSTTPQMGMDYAIALRQGKWRAESTLHPTSLKPYTRDPPGPSPLDQMSMHILIDLPQLNKILIPVARYNFHKKDGVTKPEVYPRGFTQDLACRYLADYSQHPGGFTLAQLWIYLRNYLLQRAFSPTLSAQDGQPLKDPRALHAPKNTAVEAAAALTEVTSRQLEQGSENDLTDVDHADQPTDYAGENKTKKSKRKRNKRNK